MLSRRTVIQIAILILIIVVGSYPIITRTDKHVDYSYIDEQPVTWKVGLALPQSGIELLDYSTVSNWDFIASNIKSNLLLHGFDENNIFLEQTNERVEQVKQIDKLVNDNHVDILLTVPVELSRDETYALYGDNVTPYLRTKWHEVVAKAAESGDKTILDKSPYSKIQDEALISQSEQKHLTETIVKLNSRTLKDALSDAKAKNILTLGFGNNTIDDFPFDYFFATPSPEDIANVQAGFAVAHLGLPELDEVGNAPTMPETWTPKNVEILVEDGVRSTSKRFFTALWKRISPYFKSGYLHSNSGLLTANTTADDYIGVSVDEDGDKAAGIMHNWLDKYYKQDSLETNLSLIFAQSDALSRGAVRACVESSWSASDARWPIITGSGSERISLLDLLEDKQAMTIGYDSKMLANGVAQVIYNFATKQSFITTDAITQNNELLFNAINSEDNTIYFAELNESNNIIKSMVARPITIETKNIKPFLVDNDYISANKIGL